MISVSYMLLYISRNKEINPIDHNTHISGEIIMKKKYIIAVAAVLSMIIILCSACGSLDEDTEMAIKDDVYSTYEKLRTDWKKANSVKEVRKAIISFASQNEISYSRLSNDNLLLTLDATDDYVKAPVTILQCDIGLDHKSQRAQCAAIILAAISNSKEHGAVKVFFTASDNTNYYGAHSLTKNQLKAGNFISLDYCEKTKLYTGSAASKDYLLTQKLKYTKTTGNAAYKISITGLEGGDSSDRTRKHGNPIKALGELMNSCQSSGMAYQVTSLSGGSETGTYPSNAEMIISVDKNDEDKLLDKFNSMEENFNDTYLDNENDLKISCEKCKLPQSSYSETDTANIMSFLYTVSDGVFATEDGDEDGDPIAISNIGYIRQSGKKTLELGMKARSIDQTQFKIMFDSYKDTAELSDFTIKEAGSFPMWPFRENSALAESYMIAAQQMDIDFEPEWTFAENECAIFYDKRPDLDMICIGANIQEGQELAESLVLYLQSLGGED